MGLMGNILHVRGPVKKVARSPTAGEARDWNTKVNESRYIPVGVVPSKKQSMYSGEISAHDPKLGTRDTIMIWFRIGKREFKGRFQVARKINSYFRADTLKHQKVLLYMGQNGLEGFEFPK